MPPYKVERDYIHPSHQHISDVFRNRILWMSSGILVFTVLFIQFSLQLAVPFQQLVILLWGLVLPIFLLNSLAILFTFLAEYFEEQRCIGYFYSKEDESKADEKIRVAKVEKFDLRASYCHARSIEFICGGVVYTSIYFSLIYLSWYNASILDFLRHHLYIINIVFFAVFLLLFTLIIRFLQHSSPESRIKA